MIKKIYPVLTILLGAAIYAFGLTYFVVPHHLFEGGATGITLITFYLFKIPVSLMNLLINSTAFCKNGYFRLKNDISDFLFQK